MNDDLFQERVGTLREIDPPAGARGRVRQALEAKARTRSRARWGLVAVAVPVAALVIWFVYGRPDEVRAPNDPRITETIAIPEAPRVTPEAPSIITLATGDTFDHDGAHLIATAPSQLELRGDALVVHGGALDVAGSIQIRGGTCDASIDGQCHVEWFESSLRISIEAGHVETAPTATCSIVDLDAPSADATPRPPRARRDRLDTSELAQQTAAYREAIALSGHDDDAALASLRAMKARWPRGSLAPEVDFQIVRTLVHLDRLEEARTAARRFVRRYPRSARAPEMRRLFETP